MYVSKKSSRKPIRVAEQDCLTRGFFKHGANWYRIYGQDLLQVITFNGLPDRTTDASFELKPTVAFIVYSMYACIPWVYIPTALGKRDVIPTITAGAFVHKSKFPPFFGPYPEAVYISEQVLPFLDGMHTHSQLAELLEAVDCWDSGRIRANDGQKVIPYLLSGRMSNVLDTIDSIEKQNLNAHLQNCKIAPGYDSVAQKYKNDDRMAAFASIRSDILSNNPQGILEVLLSNYQNNRNRLEKMGIPIPEPQISGKELISTIALQIQKIKE